MWGGGKSLENQLVGVLGATTKIGLKDILKQGKNPVITQEADRFISGYSNNENVITDLPLIVFGDHSCTFKYVDFPFLRGADGTQLIKVDREKWDTKFLYYYLRTIKIENSEKYERHFKYLKMIKIPLIELEIQQKIVSEIEGYEEEIKKLEEIMLSVGEKKKEVIEKYL